MAPAARPQLVAQQSPGARHLLVGDLAGLSEAEVHAEHGADAAHFSHHIDREIVESATIAQQIAFENDRRQGAWDGDAGAQGLDARRGAAMQRPG